MHSPRKEKEKPWSGEFISAASRGHIEKVQELLSGYTGDRNSDELRIALRRALQAAAGHGDAATVGFLLIEGAGIDAAENETPALIRAVEARSLPAVKHLVSQKWRLRRAPPLPAGLTSDGNETDQKALFFAVSEGRPEIVQELLLAGIDANIRDRDGKTALINLCAQGKDTSRKHKPLSGEHSQYQELVELLESHNADLELKDSSSRAALHWAVARGNLEMVDILLAHGADVKARGRGQMTSLHIAAGKPSVEMVQLLLKAGMNPQETNERSWTPLHFAAKEGHLKILQTLIDHKEPKVDAEAVTIMGRTALHWAAENGHTDCVRCLLTQSQRRRHAKDSKGKSPWMLAAKKHHTAIMHLLSPLNDDEHLSPLAKVVCQEYFALITDVHPQKHGRNRYVSCDKVSVYDLLYAKSQKEPKPLIPVRAKQDSIRKGGFRWIHLPANNMAWIEVLLTKFYIERGAKEVDAIQKTTNFLHLQHRGNTVHSQYMKPSCRWIPSTSREGVSGTDSLGDQLLDRWNDLEEPSKPDLSFPRKEVESPRRIDSEMSEKPYHTWQKNKSGLQAAQTKPEDFASLPNNPTTDSISKSKPKIRRTNTGLASIQSVESLNKIVPPTRPASRMSQHSVDNAPRTLDKPGPSHFGEIFLFMPYLHFETYEKSKRMSKVQDEVFQSRNPRKASTKAKYQDEEDDFEDVISSSLPQDRPALEQMFFSAHDTASINSQTPLTPITPLTPKTPREPPEIEIDQDKWSRDVKLTHAYLLEASPLHPRRTLDQFYYPTANTADRDNDQVVYRYYEKYGMKNPKVFMVDQLWLWVLDKDLVITSFPSHWEEEDRDNSFDLAHAVLDDLKEFHLSTAYDLVSCITSKCSGLFYTNRNHEEYHFLEMFEQSVADLQDEQPELSLKFKKASKEAEKWFRDGSKIEKNPSFDDYFTRVGKEMKLLTEAKDIGNELDMISSVLKTQAKLLPALKDAVKREFKIARSSEQKLELKTTFDAQVHDINGIVGRLKRMDRDVGEFFNACTQLLDLKQKFAGVFEARYSRTQAASSVRQGHTIMVFTIVTVIFLPISFIASFFAIPIPQFQPNVALDTVLKFVFPIGLLVSVPLVILAFTVDNITRLWHKFKNVLRKRKKDESDDDVSNADENRSTEHMMRRLSTVPTLSQGDAEFLEKHGHNHTHLLRHLFGGWHEHEEEPSRLRRRGTSDLFKYKRAKKSKEAESSRGINRRISIRWDEEKGNAE